MLQSFRATLRRYRLPQHLSGFGLVELMVTITLMAIVGVGVVSIMDYVQSTRVRVQKSVELISDIDQAELYIRTKLKTADLLDFVYVPPLGDDLNNYNAECLLLLKRQPVDRTGVSFVNNAGKIATTTARGPGLGSSFTVSMWFKRDNTTHTALETLARWGRHSSVDNSSVALVMTPMGELATRFGTRTALVADPMGLNDKRWHHLVATYDNSTPNGILDSNSWKIYVDGFPRSILFVDPNIALNVDNGTSADYFSIGDHFTADNTTFFGGLIADVQLYNTAASPGNAAAIYTEGTLPINMEEVLRWEFDNLTNNVVTDSYTTGNSGSATGLSATNPTVTTTDERYIGEVFAMVDETNDGNDNYVLKHRTNHKECPKSAADAAQFTTVSEDIFVRPTGGDFFERSTADANGVLFNYGYRSGQGRTGVSYDAKPKKLALNKKFFDEDFCLADPNLVLNKPPSATSCPISRGYAYIATDYDNLSDELFIPNAQFWPDNNTYYNIPNAPNNINATWSAATGVLTYFTTDNSSVEIEEWEKTLRSLSYRPKTEDYTPKKDIIISLGYLPMKINNEYHFYEFIEVNDGVTVKWGASQAAANASTFCGTAGYLATVTSAEENDFLIQRFRKTTGAVPAGWLGGSDNATNGQWVWEANSPEAGIRFWDQTNVANAEGRPVSNTGLDVDNSTFTMTDDVAIPGAPANAFKRRITVSTDPAVTLHYHNWASYEPNDVGSGNGEPYLQIVGSTVGRGLWNDLPDNRPCVDNEKYDPCGYYVEYGGRPGQSLNSLVYERTIDLSVQREFCKQ